jgi:hypothetical protein
MEQGHKCEGYIQKPKPRQEYTSPRPNVAPKRAILPLGKEGILRVYAQPHGSRFNFHTPDEYRYFQRFQTKTAFHLSGFYEPGLWNRIILQASELQESIRHAVIALGALDMTTSRMTETESSPGSTSSPQERLPAAETYHIFALKQYSKAIKQMREQSLNSKHDLRTALVASLLIITFETYHGNYSSAGDQIRAAIRLIEERSSSSSSPPPEKEVEEDILFAFNRLAIQEISHTDGFTLAEHLTLKETNSSRIRDMPEVFTDITTARGYFNMIARQCAHFGCAFWMSDNTFSNKPSLALFDRTQAPSQSMAPELLKQLGHDRYIDLCVRFLRAFNPLYEKHHSKSKPEGAKSEEEKRDGSACMSIRINFMCMWVCLQFAGGPTEVCYDAFLPTFSEMNDIASKMLDQQQSIFTFDLQTLWPLDLVAQKCRDGKVRREAIRLMKVKPRREGIWDSMVAAGICEWVVRLEESGMRDGFIPEESRVRNIGSRLDLESRRANAWCYLPTERGGLKKLEAVVTW